MKKDIGSSATRSLKGCKKQLMQKKYTFRSAKIEAFIINVIFILSYSFRLHFDSVFLSSFRKISSIDSLSFFKQKESVILNSNSQRL